MQREISSTSIFAPSEGACVITSGGSCSVLTIGNELMITTCIINYPAPVHHLQVRCMNGRRLMSPTPTTIPITQTLNFVILNIPYLFRITSITIVLSITF